MPLVLWRSYLTPGTDSVQLLCCGNLLNVERPDRCGLATTLSSLGLEQAKELWQTLVELLVLVFLCKQALFNHLCTVPMTAVPGSIFEAVYDLLAPALLLPTQLLGSLTLLGQFLRCLGSLTDSLPAVIDT